MIEIIGWVIVVVDEPNDEFTSYSKVSDDLKGKVPVELKDNITFSIKNNRLVLEIWGYHNRPLTRDSLLYEYLRVVGIQASFSFGVVFVNDDEGVERNEYVVHKMTKGVLTRIKDPFFSPIVPTITNE